MGDGQEYRRNPSASGFDGHHFPLDSKGRSDVRFQLNLDMSSNRIASQGGVRLNQKAQEGKERCSRAKVGTTKVLRLKCWTVR